ncbi:hypothetical protein RHGRI_037424 [Rhododendron griersonianum]|uniref:Strictosidine synthase conserved region domain-containing protein n=1 Tax=Rhododendron griersonianum TaxID=479676 RepID=A0AAV6HRN8_9ERIC|nr:hypothetical protein RHGRI_037424 [Rhododendron griersonianum]
MEKRNLPFPSPLRCTKGKRNLPFPSPLQRRTYVSIVLAYMDNKFFRPKASLFGLRKLLEDICELPEIDYISITCLILPLWVPLCDYGFRSELCDPKPSPLSYLRNEHICGRPLGLRFDKKTGYLYIADAYFGLLKVGPEGGLATSLATEAEGVPLRFTNDLDLDDEGNIYFTDSSTKYQRRNFMQSFLSAEDSGRVLKYNPSTKETTVLVRNLQFPNGVSLSKDGLFFVFCEMVPARLRKYWLKGEKAGTSEVMAILPGFPDNIRTNEKGEFWVAINSRRTMYGYLCGLYPTLRKFLLKLPIPLKFHIGGRPHAVVVKYSPEGKLLQILEDSQGKVVKAVSEVEEKDGKLWIGSVFVPYVAVYQL